LLRLIFLQAIVVKDSSANKGGVTSSSLEVLAALALTDAEFEAKMMVKDKSNPPPFYKAYVQVSRRGEGWEVTAQDVLDRIRANAELVGGGGVMSWP
jgi:hypothetical protein